MMAITSDGIEAERKGRLYLRNMGFTNLQQIDWLVKKPDDRYVIIEVKQRELFNPPPFWGTGLDISQLNLRKQVYNDLGIDTLLIVFESGTNNIYTGYLSILETLEYFDTRNNIRIYNIEHFCKTVF